MKTEKLIILKEQRDNILSKIRRLEVQLEGIEKSISKIEKLESDRTEEK